LQRNDDYNTVAGAAAVALHELRSAFGVEGEEGETMPLLAKKQSSGQLSRSKPLKGSDTPASGKKIIYDSLNESKAKKMGLTKNKKKEKTGEEEEGEDEDDGDIQFTGESMRHAGAGATSAGSILDSSMYLGLDEAAKGGESNKNLEREDSGELVRKRKPNPKQIASASSSSYASLSASELSAPSNQANATSPAGASPRGDAAPGEAEAGDEDQIYLFQANAETDEEREKEKENENENEKATENEGEEEAEAEAEGKGGAKKSKNPLMKSLEAMKKLSERSLRKSDGGLKKTIEKNMEKNERKRGKSEQALKRRETKKAEAEQKKSQEEPKKSAEAELPAPPVAAPPQQWLMPERKVKVSTLGSSIREQDSFYASILDSKQSLALGSDDDSDDSSSDSD
jgi:hypothetical protein